MNTIKFTLVNEKWNVLIGQKRHQLYQPNCRSKLLCLSIYLYYFYVDLSSRIIMYRELGKRSRLDPLFLMPTERPKLCCGCCSLNSSQIAPLEGAFPASIF